MSAPSILHMNQTLRDREYLAEKFWKSILPVHAAAVPVITREAKALGEVIATVDPVLGAWRDANPNSRFPHWWKVLYDFCSSCPDRAWCACGLFVQTATVEIDGKSETITNTNKLLSLARRSVRMASCSHARGTWSGHECAAYGEYEDNLIFTCPDCGYKGS